MIPPTQNTSGKVTSVTYDTNFNLGCGKEFLMKTSSGFICGVPNAMGTEKLCDNCMTKLRIKWAKEDKERKNK